LEDLGIDGSIIKIRLKDIQYECAYVNCIDFRDFEVFMTTIMNRIVHDVIPYRLVPTFQNIPHP
jgi:hypothetical protein